MRGPKELLESENIWITSMGACFPHQARVIFRGKDLFTELNDISWVGLIFFGITGRHLEENQARLYEGIWNICTSYPDPRIWNNRVAALAGTTRSTAALAISSAMAVTEASIYGYRPIIRTIDFLHRTQEMLAQGVDLAQLIDAEKEKYGMIPGFGRPFVKSEDERVKPVLKLMESLGFNHGPYVKLIFRIEEILHSRWGLHMNIAALLAAIFAE